MIFVLVAGAWHGAWCWERVRPLLEAQGHRVLTPDLPGMGADPTPLAQTSFAGWVSSICALITRQPEPVILVGHSRAGIVISQVAERTPQAVRANVYLAAMLVPHGKRMSDMMEAPNPDIISAVRIEPDGMSTTLAPEIVGPVFYTCTEPALVSHAIARLTAEPIFSGAAVMDLSDERFGLVSRFYIECLQDRAVPLSRQRSMQHGLPCRRAFALDTDHSPFYSAPPELAACLLEVAGEVQ